MKGIVIFVTSIICLLVFVYFYKLSRENFADVHGIIAFDEHEYVKCLSDCHRASSTHFRDSFTNMQLHCERRCNRISDEKVRKTQEEQDNLRFNRFNESSKLEYNNGVIADQETHACLKEVSEYCTLDYCSHAKNRGLCQKSCEHINKYRCSSGLNFSWKP